MKRTQGFTFLELVIVGIILSIVVGVSIPGFQRMRESVLIREAKTNLNMILAAQRNFFSKYREYAKTFAELNLNLPTENFKNDIYNPKLSNGMVASIQLKSPFSFSVWFNTAGKITESKSFPPSGTPMDTRE